MDITLPLPPNTLDLPEGGGGAWVSVTPLPPAPWSEGELGPGSQYPRVPLGPGGGVGQKVEGALWTQSSGPGPPAGILRVGPVRSQAGAGRCAPRVNMCSQSVCRCVHMCVPTRVRACVSVSSRAMGRSGGNPRG